MLQPTIVQLPPKTLIGTSLSMSVQNNRTGELWKSFMPRRGQIINQIGTELYSLQVYPANYFQAFNPEAVFEKWALVEVRTQEAIPEGMQAFNLDEGLYACFHYQGPSTDKRIFQYIFGEWIPQSEYVIDDRPHFELLGPKYSNTSPNSEEDIYVPIRLKD